MKNEQDADLIGIYGNFSIGVVTGERRFYLNGNGTFRNAKGEDTHNYYDKQMKNGDIIQVKMDMTFGRLEFSVNDEDLGVAFKFGCHKKCLRNYKLNVIFKKKLIKCEILSYKVNKCTHWECEKCTTRMRIRADVCKYCNWSRIKGKTKGLKKILAEHEKHFV